MNLLRRALLALVLLAAAQVQAQAPAPATDPRTLAAQAIQLQALGFRQKAVELLEQAYRDAQAAPADPELAASMSGLLGQAYLRAGDFAHAEPRLREALEQARRASRPALAAAALNDLGQLDAALGRREAALAAFRDSLATASDPLLVAAAGGNAARLLGSAKAAEAGPLLERAERALDGAPDSRERDLARIRLARIREATGGSDSVERRYRLLSAALDAAQRRGDPVALSYAAGELGVLYSQEHRDAEAIGLLERAVFAGQREQAPEAVYRWTWEAGRVLARAGEREPALAAYRRALASLQAVRQDLILELRASGQSWRGAVGPLYLEYADLLLRHPAGESAAQQDLVEARSTIEQLKAVELEDYFQDDCVAAQTAKQKDIDAIEPATAVLYPVILPDRVEILLGLAGGIRQVTLPITGAWLTEQAHGFRRMLEKRTTNQYLPYARRLYQAFFQPLEPVLREQGVKTIVFIPDGALRGVPIAALNDGKGFLVERYAFATAPGLTLIEPQALAQKKEVDVLVNGITEAVQHFPALPYVGEELADLKAVFADAHFLRDREFRIPDFEREMRRRPYSIVHIASHGEFDSDPRKSFLLTYDGRLSMNELEGVMKIARFREDPVELLTLSACRTAAGDDRASLGLAGVAVKAGARSALASLWYVNDQASSLLVAEFYRRLGKESKARALQEAQRAVLADPRFRHAGYWAPFLLIGNWL